MAGARLSEVFEEEPVPLTAFVRDKNFLAAPPLSDEQYMAVRHIEQVLFPYTYEAMAIEMDPYWSPVRMVNIVTLEWGKGSGKDHICRVASLRVCHILSCMRSPQSYFGMPPFDTIHALNVASSAPQAYRAYFKPIKETVKRGWFKDHCHAAATSILWKKNIEQISGHSDAETQEGLNLILGVADEVDAMKTRAELEKYHANAARQPVTTIEAILEMLHTSASTRFPETYKEVRISFPRYLGSTIQVLRQKGRSDIARYGSGSRHYVSGPLATWDVNPRIKGPEDFKQDYEDDPVLARAKYECKPSRATTPFFRNELAVRAAFKPYDEPRLTIDYRPTGEARVWDASFRFADDIIPIAGARYAMHGDIAIRRDRAGVAMSHVTRWQEITRIGLDEEGGHVPITVRVPMVKCDFVAAFEADMGHGREIRIAWYRQLIAELRRRGFPIVSCTFDSFQSEDSLQQLRGLGIEAEVLSMDKSDAPYADLREVLYEDRLEVPYSGTDLEDVTCLMELLGLVDLKGKVDHVPGGSKDEADALCGSVLGAILTGGAEDPSGEQVYPGWDTALTVPSVTELPLDMTDLDSIRWSA